MTENSCYSDSAEKGIPGSIVLEEAMLSIDLTGSFNMHHGRPSLVGLANQQGGIVTDSQLPSRAGVASSEQQLTILGSSNHAANPVSVTLPVPVAVPHDSTHGKLALAMQVKCSSIGARAANVGIRLVNGKWK